MYGGSVTQSLGFSEVAMRVIFFGTGAMACFFAARFALSGVARITMMGTWTEAIHAIRKNGICIEDAAGTRLADVDAAFYDKPVPRADLAIVLVKSWQTPRVAGLLEKNLKPGGTALSLQNGLGNIEALGGRAFAGVTFEGATLICPGHVAHHGIGTTFITAPEPVLELFRCAGFETYGCAPEKTESLVWGKLAVNCGINALTVLCGVKNGELLKRRSAAVLMEKATMECAAVAKARGVELPYADPAAEVRETARRTAGNMSSMLMDVLRGAPTECDAINGAVVREGKRLGIPVPVNEALWRAINKRDET
jgi:2-dehydropantoate 2-reductase